MVAYSTSSTLKVMKVLLKMYILKVKIKPMTIIIFSH
jgi:hypothetical protein